MGLEKVCKFFATLGPIGYLPAPGTMASAAVLIALYFIKPCSGFCCYTFLVLISIIISFFIIEWTQRYYKLGDASEIVIDEYVGALIAIMFLPVTIPVYMAAFIMFRFFDIYKPLGIRKIEELPGAFGVLFDDVVAGVYSWIVVYSGLVLYGYFF